MYQNLNFIKMKKLSRNEMKNVMGGVHPGWGGCIASCSQGGPFSVCSCEEAANFCSFGGRLICCSCEGNPNTCP